MDPKTSRKHIDEEESNTRNVTVFGLTKSDLGRTQDASTISDWTTTNSFSRSSSEPMVPNYLNGLKPIVIEPHLEKTHWKQRVTLKVSLVVACLLMSCLAFGVVAYQYRNRKVPEAAFSNEEDLNPAVTMVTGKSSYSDYSYSSYIDSSLESRNSYADNFSNSSRGRISLEDIDLMTDRIRLVGGSNQYEGRVELLRQNQWGTICHKKWNIQDGRVTCRQLGFGDVITAPKNARFGQGSGSILYSRFQCTGSESRLNQCPSSTNIRGCNHAMDASVRCQAPDTSSSACDNAPCQNGGTCRNMNDGNDFECSCTSSWSGNVCTTAAVLPCSSGPCNNGATCSNNGESYQCTCAPGWSGTRCDTDDQGNPGTTVRLVGGTAFAGRVEILRNGVWGTICDDLWGMEEAEVVCRQLGYTSAVLAYNWQDARYSHFGDRDGQIWLDNMQCTGSESKIEDCSHAGWGNNNCVHDLPFSEQAGVMCYDPSITAKVDLLNTGNCGTRPLINRIVGGDTVVDRYRWPWMGSLRDVYGNHRCGTSLISPQWAITAAHCDDVAYKVYFGDLQLSPQSSNHQESIVQVFRNPQYDEYNIDNDITLLKLNTRLTINDYVRPICLAVSSNEESRYPDGTCKAVGWGHTAWQGYLSRDLLEVDLDVITKQACLQQYWHITDNMICTDDPNREAGTCQGDSGGPLQCVKDGVWHLLGATSHGFECGGAGIPDVFARVSRYWQFIKQTVDMNGGP